MQLIQVQAINSKPEYIAVNGRVKLPPSGKPDRKITRLVMTKQANGGYVVKRGVSVFHARSLHQAINEEF